MAEAEITIFEEGRAPFTVVRPIHCDGTMRYITYKRQKWPVNSRNEVYLNTSPRACAATNPDDTRWPLPSAKKGSFAWDVDQESVVTAPVSSRLLVDAGPGTGKTEVACGRVAYLIRNGVAPANIVLVSFTRTAVAEIRERIAKLAGGLDQAYAVTITTLDAQAWKLLSGFEAESGANFFRSFDENIDSAITLLNREDEAMLDYVREFRHLIVDEAQDFVGRRADLVEAIISRLEPSCGVTIFSDEAQAIYGFAEDDEDDEDGSIALAMRLRSSSAAGDFQNMQLRQIHRTSSRSLVKIFSHVRRLVLGHGGEPLRLKRIRNSIEAAADGKAPRKASERDLDSLLVLYRTRAEVLQDSSMRWKQGEAHRVRMSGLPRPLFPWIAVLLWDWVAPHLGTTEFAALCAERLPRIPEAARPDVEAAWTQLFRIAGDKSRRVDMRRLRTRLAASQPPLGLFSPEIGWTGPIIGTIHGSKGREAAEVDLMLPRRPREDVDDEECRVLFVGATRAKERLNVGLAKVCYSGQSASRVFTKMFGWPRVEIGREDDVDVGLQVSQTIYPDHLAASRSQTRLELLINRHVTGSATRGVAAAARYAVRLTDHDTEPICVLSRKLEAGLAAIGNQVSRARLKLPRELNEIHVVGVRTVALAVDDERSQQLHEPYRKSGIFLSPIVLAFTRVAFEKK